MGCQSSASSPPADQFPSRSCRTRSPAARMGEKLNCSQCGAPIPAGGISDLCGRCLLPPVLHRDSIGTELGSFQTQRLGWELLLRKGAACLSRQCLELREYVLGRAADCDIVVDSADISQRHAKLSIDADGCWLEDLGSSNGTFVSDRPAQGRILIRPGQSIQIASVTLEIKETGSRQDVAPDQHRYTVGGVVARGGMGEILDAQQVKLGRKVAMKRLHSGQTGSQEGRLRFLQEARVLGQLEHPNVVPIHDLDQNEQGEVFYTMKF